MMPDLRAAQAGEALVGAAVAARGAGAEATDPADGASGGSSP